MIFTSEEYEAMKLYVSNCIGNGCQPDVKELVKLQLPFDIEAIRSLYNQLMLRRLKSDNLKIKGLTNIILSELTSSSLNTQSLTNIAKELNMSSYKAAKIVIEAYVGTSISVPQFIENPHVIKDEMIRLNVLESISNDPIQNLECDRSKECVGQQYEVLLIQQLQAKNMCFETEAELRSRGTVYSIVEVVVLVFGIVISF